MFKKGQYIRVIGDSYTSDPHGLEIGSIYEVHSISPPLKYEDFPPLVKLLYQIDGTKPHDLPERVHVKTGQDFQDYANLVFEDVELVKDYEDDDWEEWEDDEDGIYEVKMLEDDIAEGFSKGDIFVVHLNDDGEPFIYDHDGEVRHLFYLEHKYKVI